jgi:hypothetical protein
LGGSHHGKSNGRERSFGQAVHDEFLLRRRVTPEQGKSQCLILKNNIK